MLFVIIKNSIYKKKLISLKARKVKFLLKLIASFSSIIHTYKYFLHAVKRKIVKIPHIGDQSLQNSFFLLCVLVFSGNKNEKEI